MSKARRRTSAEWRRIVTEWDRSGEGAAAFARRWGVSSRTLGWWRWRLRKEAEAKAATPNVEFVPVRLAEPGGQRNDCDEGVVWELVTPSGHVLRVYERSSEELREAVAALAGQRRQD